MNAPGVVLADGDRVELFEELDPTATGAFLALARELEERHLGLAESALRRLRRDFSASEGTTAFAAEEVAGFLGATLRVQLGAFRRGILPAECPSVDANAVLVLTKTGELHHLLSAYRIIRSVLWEVWFELVENAPQSVATRNELLGFGAQYFSGYASMLCELSAEIYRGELQRSSEDTEGRRLRAIRSVLDGKAPASLEFDFDQYHLGALARGECAEQGIRRLAATLERPAFIAGPLNGTWWGWISGARPFEPLEEGLIERFAPPEGVRLALGQPAYGEEGFRATHRQAARARWASRSLQRPLIRYADVAVELLAVEDPAEARRFVARELRGIADDSAESERIRQTLAAYFAAEHNAASAAASLGVHQQTVANRLRSVEERLGHPVGRRRVELELALRLRLCLGIEDGL